MKKKIKLMVVDDESRFLSTSEKILSRRGFDVITADSGPAALTLLEEHAVQVVVLDVKMPGMDGIETLKAIRQTRPKLEVIILTGHANVSSVVEAMQMGATDYLMKPVAMYHLMERVREAARRSVNQEVAVALEE